MGQEYNEKVFSYSHTMQLDLVGYLAAASSLWP
jgi:hypothetical protein